ncbi:MAG: hypothetical protein OXD31_04385, partial [Chloroflexi bacterium]|nr:hypothetical protein [Chloroflexota bacterium]
LIVRGQHDTVERRIASAVALRERLGEALPHVARLIAYTQTSESEDYFCDAIGEKYSVVVEERALGVPLVGSATDGIKRHPIGAPQNLFAIHPVIPHQKRGRFSVVRDLLDVAEICDRDGMLLLDMRPQNIYFDPLNARITVIDICGVTKARPAVGRKPPLDLHDFYLELFKWYMPHADPPSEPEGYRQPVGMETIPLFTQNLDGMIRRHTERSDEDCGAVELDILRKIRARDYPSIRAFRSDFEAYLSLLERRYEELSDSRAIRQAWQAALEELKDDYWRKFLFNFGCLSAYTQPA